MLIDLYVSPAYRGRGLAPDLICAIAADITALGWEFLWRMALSEGAARLYGRVAVCFGSHEYNVSGTALKQLASLAGTSARQILQGLPTLGMNAQP